MSEARWYVVHTYSGYENKVKANIDKTIENRNLQDQILEVVVPTRDEIEVRNGVKKVVTRKIFPGYVLVHMVYNDDTWYVVRNTRGVTGFVGPDSVPVPLTPAEMKKLGISAAETEEPMVVNIDVEVGDSIEVISGAYAETVSTVKAVNMAKQLVTIEVEMFGRPTSVEIGFTEIKKM